ncbi:MAG: hypothetical protein Q9159_000876 [Coniocarpon cinnabarinum]
MPPIRNIQIPAKPVKTERSHEENQERAYIAASRRSDRSLEARVESARRASEIHKRRTGRSLRVTEQDVVNEEMYEEEDDDLPAQYRRLANNLHGYGSDFNRRLATYLTNHVALRQALGQASAGGQPDGSMNPAMLNNPFAANGMMMGPGFPYSNFMSPDTMHRQRSSQSQKPAPVNVGPAKTTDSNKPKPVVKTNQSGQPASSPSAPIKSPNSNASNQLGPQSGSPNATPSVHHSPHSSAAGSNVQSPLSTHSHNHNNSMNSYPAQSHNQPQASMQFQPDRSGMNSHFQNPYQPNPQAAFHPQQGPYAGSPSMMSPISPLTTQLPMDAQMFFDPSAATSPFDNFSQQPFYNYNPNLTNSKPTDTSSVATGMSQTLAPPAFESKQQQTQTAWPTPPDDQSSPFSSNGQVNFGEDPMFGGDDFTQQGFDGMFADGLQSSEDDFSNLINQDMWGDSSGAQA